MEYKKRGDKVSPRTGRPKAENPKEFSLKIRFDRELNDRLDAFCQENNLTKAEAARKGILMLLGEKER